MNQNAHDPLPDDMDTDLDPDLSPAQQDEASISGSAPDPASDDDTEETLEDAWGVDVEPGKPFSMAEAMEEEELRRRGFDVDDFDDED